MLFLVPTLQRGNAVRTLQRPGTLERSRLDFHGDRGNQKPESTEYLTYTAFQAQPEQCLSFYSKLHR